jgi:BA14K-like protein
MEPGMINLKVLSTAAILALVLPVVLPSASFAQAGPGKPRGAIGGGGGFRAGGAPHVVGGGGGPRFSGGGGGRYHGGGGGYYRHGGGGGFIPGAVAGAVIGGAIASGGYYGGYGGPAYAPGYYDDGGYDDGAVAVAPAPAGDDSVGYCMQRYRSYDPNSGTYLGNDGYRHPCP